MKRVFILFIILCCVITTYAQHSIKLSIKNKEEGTPLMGATVKIDSINKLTISDSLGIAILSNIPAGTFKIKVTYVGFEEQEEIIQVPQVGGGIMEIYLIEQEEHEEEVIVKATRISRMIANIPTRLEVISGEELVEKGNMKPGDIRMMLNESTGIQTQQTSATSFNAGIRIQGLEGRYTQILKDGYPLYAGFSGGLSILQIPPLDLKQVEVIKGAASTLYGGGAIAGLVNLVSKTPGEKKELNFLFNGTSAGGLDMSNFYSQSYGKLGLTLFTSRNSNSPFDPANNGMTAIPKFERYTINPRLFLYGKKTTADIGVTYITEDRTGGSINYIKNEGLGYYEKNNTDRVSTQAGIRRQLSENSSIQFKNSYSHFNRVIQIPTYIFDALQQTSFSELTWNKEGAKLDWVIGGNFLTDQLKERSQLSDPKRNYQLNTYGLFIQNVWSVSDKFVLESGIRGDYVQEYGFELLPRVSAMVKVSPKLTTRIGGGFGYKTPSIFTEEAEKIQFKNVLPIAMNSSQLERSIGANWDVNYKTKIGDVGVSLNQLFFYTRLNHPLVILTTNNGNLNFQNSDGYLDTKGIETNIRLTYSDFKLFIGYTLTDANTHYTNKNEWLPLTARHRLNNVLMYEIEDKLKIGLEAYYFSKQRLTDGSIGKSYWITGLMAEKLWETFSLFINFENFSNTRQSRFDSIFTGTINSPIFKDIYAPVEGFVVNGGLKIKL